MLTPFDNIQQIKNVAAFNNELSCLMQKLTAEEKEKRRLRRERNKMAAYKCRLRRKEKLRQLDRVRALSIERVQFWWVLVGSKHWT